MTTQRSEGESDWDANLADVVATLLVTARANGYEEAADFLQRILTGLSIPDDADLPIGASTLLQ